MLSIILWLATTIIALTITITQTVIIITIKIIINPHLDEGEFY